MDPELLLWRWSTTAQTASALMIAIFVIRAASYNLVIGYGGLATVAHPIFFALGAYTAALLAIHTGLAAPICVLAGAAAATIASRCCATSISPSRRARA